MAEPIDSVKLTVEVAQTFGLDQMPEAFAASAEGNTQGKLVIVLRSKMRT